MSRAVRCQGRESGLRGERGGVLVEFALIALALYFLLGLLLDFGRLIFTAQALQEAARVAARELALAPLPAAMTFEDVLQDPTVRANLYDPARLVIPVTDDATFQATLASLPTINKVLVPLMIHETIDGVDYLRYPGAILTDDEGGLTVGIPRVVSRDEEGVETIEWVAPIEEIRPDPNDPTTGPFSIASTGPERGLVAIRINYPFQAAMLVGFQGGTSPIVAADEAVIELNSPPSGQAPLIPPGTVGVYAGPFGLGAHYNWGMVRRPFRKLLAAQAVFRREVLL
ncbi:MAG: pilus assembly protein [Nitrospira sp.]|nr:pilus assembly protein [Nitrospira sp.]